jgi:hypothetical protein
MIKTSNPGLYTCLKEVGSHIIHYRVRFIDDGAVATLNLMTECIQATAPLSAGSSDGGLFDDRGNLTGKQTSRSAIPRNLNFAIATSQFWK